MRRSLVERRPVIGVVSYGRGSDPTRYALPVEYGSAVQRAGGRVVILPPGDEQPDEILASVDAVIFAGGGDLDPQRYGQLPHATLYGVDPERDALELEIARAVVGRRVPALAICRGLQVVNVALGGDLVQHLPDLVADRVAHRAGVGESTVHRV